MTFGLHCCKTTTRVVDHGPEQPLSPTHIGENNHKKAMCTLSFWLEILGHLPALFLFLQKPVRFVLFLSTSMSVRFVGPNRSTTTTRNESNIRGFPESFPRKTNGDQE